VERTVCGARKGHVAARNKNRHYKMETRDVKSFDLKIMKLILSAARFVSDAVGTRLKAEVLNQRKRFFPV
jgi:hypothetical protein